MHHQVEEHFNHPGQPPFQLELEDEGAPVFAPTVVAFLNQTLHEGAPMSPSETAAKFDGLFQEHYTENSTSDGFLWWFWDLMHDLARQVRFDSTPQDRLVATIKALQDLPPKTVNLGEEWGEGGSPIELWTNLPQFANTFRETLTDGDQRAPEHQRKDRQLNLQSYTARVASLCGLPFEVYAVWALVDALESPLFLIKAGQDRDEGDRMGVSDTEYNVRTAAIWMIHTGHVLYGRDEEIEGATAGPLWKLDKKEARKLGRKFKGTYGLCQLRWELWKERFGAVLAEPGIDEMTRTLASKAMQRMDKVERDKAQ